MNLQGIILSEIRQKEKDKYHMILLICGTVKNKTNETKTQRAYQWLAKGKRFGGQTKRLKELNCVVMNGK